MRRLHPGGPTVSATSAWKTASPHWGTWQTIRREETNHSQSYACIFACTYRSGSPIMSAAARRYMSWNRAALRSKQRLVGRGWQWKEPAHTNQVRCPRSDNRGIMPVEVYALCQWPIHGTGTAHQLGCPSAETCMPREQLYTFQPDLRGMWKSDVTTITRRHPAGSAWMVRLKYALPTLQVCRVAGLGEHTCAGRCERGRGWCSLSMHDAPLGPLSYENAVI